MPRESSSRDVVFATRLKPRGGESRLQVPSLIAHERRHHAVRPVSSFRLSLAQFADKLHSLDICARRKLARSRVLRVRLAPYPICCSLCLARYSRWLCLLRQFLSASCVNPWHGDGGGAAIIFCIAFSYVSLYFAIHSSDACAACCVIPACCMAASAEATLMPSSEVAVRFGLFAEESSSEDKSEGEGVRLLRDARCPDDDDDICRYASMAMMNTNATMMSMDARDAGGMATWPTMDFILTDCLS